MADKQSTAPNVPKNPPKTPLSKQLPTTAPAPAPTATLKVPPRTSSTGPTTQPDNEATPQSNIVKHVPSRAKSVDQILSFAEKLKINNIMLIKIGLRMNGNLLFGSNHRCVAMLIMFKSLMDDISSVLQQQRQGHSHLQQALTADTPRLTASLSERPLAQLQKLLEKAMDFLDFCRPLSVSMSNGYNLVRDEILKLEQASTDAAIAKLRLDESPARPVAGGAAPLVSPTPKVSSEQAIYEEHKKQLKKFIDQFIDEEIWSAQRGICENISGNIKEKDVILVYGCSTIVQHVLLHAKVLGGKEFRVIVVDSPPHFSGRRMMSFLHDNSMTAQYTLVNSLSFVMRSATKILLGANSILATGYVMSHIGTSQVALMAKASNVPTLVCCETYKLSDRVYVDSFGCNEIDSGHELGNLILNLRYDLTPPEFVSMVITEKSTVPAESVPALLRFRAERTKSNHHSSQHP